MQKHGIHKELQRLWSGIRAVGERVDGTERGLAMNDKAVQVISKQLAVLESLFKAELKHIREDQSRTLRELEKINGTVQEYVQRTGHLEKETALLQQTWEEQIKPVLKVAQANRLEIAKRAAKWAAIGVVGGALVTGLIQLLIHIL